MALNNLSAIQTYLREHDIDGWLVFDFRGQNYIATSLFKLTKDALMTRRWFYFIPKSGEPRLLLHKIERGNFPDPPPNTEHYVSWQQLQEKLTGMLAGAGKIAMEYSPEAAIPYVSCVDAGTIEMVRKLGVEIVTSANLVQYFQSRWTEEQLASHKRAAAQVERIKNEAFALIGERIRSGAAVTELDIQRFIMDRFSSENMTTEEAPIVAVNANASNPHYAPTAERFSPIQKGDLVLIDLFSKENDEQAIWADVTWIGYVGEHIEEKHDKVFKVVTAGRDAGLQLLKDAAKANQTVQGWQVDERVRTVIAEAGYGDYFDHRTGHSLDTSLHGNGVNMDSLETQDQRVIVPGLGFTIEPGVYLPEFGIRSEINIYYSEEGPQVFGPIQREIIPILK